jgi:hypothetical protein
VVGEVVTVSRSYRGGLMRLDPSPGARPSVRAAQALATAGGFPASGEAPTVLLGRLTVSDYARGDVPFINHRLVWLVLYHHFPITCRGLASCPGVFGTSAVPVDARTGRSLGNWQWSGEN